ncbi:MAG: ATP-dependent RNA helicase HrpA, partial [Lysobacterales bacterium]
MPQGSLHRQLEEAQTRDRGRLIARLRALDQGKVGPEDARRVQLATDIAASVARTTARRKLVPPFALDETLPVAREAERIVAAIHAHPVVIVAGETGSGKTTQLPKLCLAAGRGVRGLVGCTQPRRIAARAVARRVASELNTQVGGLVGYQVRFTEEVGEDALIKFMTDGILLAEIQSDPWLSRYDTLIIDEAHERSLNIDFLLGYLKLLLERRRDLKVIVTSATIDTARFAAHFGIAPVIDVEGRSFPVEVRWRPPARDADGDDDERAGTAAIVAAVDEITRSDALCDVLIFLPGEREIRDTHLALERRAYRSTEVLPLYARLSARDQDRVFNPGPGRRIVLATNVAETSLTVPRIRYVVDPGTARISRYSHRHKVQRLHIEPISQASADQRKGRCGRVADGVCVRLYEEADYATRPRFTDPELLRSSLAGVILRMLNLRLGDPAAFPFLDAPLERAWNDGYQQLFELGALASDRSSLSTIGRELASWPIDVALARMVVAARELKSLPEILVLAAFLSIPDPRERPAAARQAADAAHALFADKRSDFIGVLNLWREFQLAHAASTQARLREWCARHFVSFMRMREWRELHRQLLLVAREARLTVPDAQGASYEAIHRALLTGFPAQVARKDEHAEFRGTRGRRYVIFPGSALAKAPPLWLLSASLLDTGRLYAMTNARVESEWIEEQAAHLVQRRLFDPHWSRAAGRVLAYEQVTLLGLPLTERRRVNYASHDPAGARGLFLL